MPVPDLLPIMSFKTHGNVHMNICFAQAWVALPMVQAVSQHPAEDA